MITVLFFRLAKRKEKKKRKKHKIAYLFILPSGELKGGEEEGNLFASSQFLSTSFHVTGRSF